MRMFLKKINGIANKIMLRLYKVNAVNVAIKNPHTPLNIESVIVYEIYNIELAFTSFSFAIMLGTIVSSTS